MMATSASSEPQPSGQQTDTSQDRTAPSNAVEMSNLPSQQQNGGASAGPSSSNVNSASSATPAPAASSSEPGPSNSNQEANPAIEAIPNSQSTSKESGDSEAIGPSGAPSSVVPGASSGPVVNIILLLGNANKHPFRIDQKYLRKRSVDVEDNDPFNISVYTMKELIWRDWRSEWEPRPSNPSYIRLISFGRLLDDNTPLKECRFNHENPNIVHMAIKPQEIVDEEDTKTGKGGRDRDGEDSHAGCRCVIL